ncbi:MAG: PTS sugar transporter subunit IIC [Gemmatimonadota bacterium]|nr:PTS sugar transporter subunit IIC [Gemmatimonadota bacterium]
MLALSTLGAVLALDATSLGQFMISRPLVAATLAGGLLGEPGLGIQIGAILELFYLSEMPSGGFRVPELGPASVVAVALASTTGGPAGVVIGITAGLLVSELGGLTVEAQRRLNMTVTASVEATRVNELRLVCAHLLAMSLDFVRGGIVTLVGISVGTQVIGIVADRWTLSSESTMAIVVVAASIHLGALLRRFGGWRARQTVFLVGLIAGIIGTYL